MRRTLSVALALLAAPALSFAQPAPSGSPTTPAPEAPAAVTPTSPATPAAPTSEPAAVGTTAHPLPNPHPASENPPPPPATTTGSGLSNMGASASGAPEDGSGGISAESTPAAPDTATGDAGSAHPTPTPPPADLAERISSAVVLHGYMRTRGDLFHNFTLGWDDPSFINSGGIYASSHLPWVNNPDNNLPNLCSTDPPLGTVMRVPGTCTNASQTSANMRLRLTPEIHVTDSITVHAQIDVLDNVVLGSTANGYYNGPGSPPSPWAPFTAFNTTQVVPTEQNGFTPSIAVSRAWAEVTNASLGQIRFGRMPSHWGLGIVANAGNGIDSDYQTTADRLMYAARIARYNLFIAAMYDFAGTGPTSASPLNAPGWGQAYSISQLTDVHQFILTLGHRVDPVEARHRLAHGDLVWNGGLYALYRYQLLDGQGTDAGGATPYSVPPNIDNYAASLIRRDAQIFIGDLWFQLLGRHFRFELEAALIQGSVNIDTAAGSTGTQPYNIQQFGGAMEFEYRLLNERLQIEFRSGLATGDSDLTSLSYQNGRIAPARGADNTLSLFQFHPDYHIDLIFWRQIMQQISGAYYFRPGVQYVFVDKPGGDHFYGRATVVWSRATEFVQTRGDHADLGIEIDAELTYMSNYRRTDMGEVPAPGFFASLQYGVFFPMAGLGPNDSERAGNPIYQNFSFSTAQTVHGILGVLF